jgi:ribose-phosphate pyrophosphokinase
MLKLFSGTANPKLAEEVASLLKLPLAESEVVRFGNSEVRVRVEEDAKNDTCMVFQSTANPTDTNLMEFFFFCDALRRQEAKRVIGVVPYFGYARQDIQHREGEDVSANVIIRFMESIGYNKIYTVDLHDETTGGVFSIPFKNLSALPMLATAVKRKLGKQNDIAIVSPDQGGIERARSFGEHYFKTPDFPLVVIEKRRSLNAIHKTEALNIYGNVKGKTAILVDDIITSGGTLISAANLCLKHGAREVLAAIVHHDFSVTAPQKIQDSSIGMLFTTNTIALKESQEFSKLNEISIASLIAEALEYLVKNNHNGY